MSRKLPVLFTRRLVQPPGAQYISPDEGLLLEVEPTVDYSLEIRARMLFPDGQQNTLRFTAPGTAIFGNTSFSFPLPEGFLLGASLAQTIVGGSTLRGMLFARLSIARGITATPYPTQLLVCNYIESNTPISWPGGPQQSPMQGPTQLTMRRPGVQPAGAEISELIDIPLQGRLVAAVFTLQTSAVAGNREVLWRVTRNTTLQMQLGCNVPQAPSTLIAYTVGPGLPAGQLASQSRSIPFPLDFWTQDVTILGTLTIGLDAADVYNFVSYTFEQRLRS